MATRICINDLKWPVEVQRNTPADDGQGGTTPAWATHIAVIWCKMVQKSGDERWARNRLEAQARVVFTTHYGIEITEKDRLSFGGKLYNIRNINNLDFENKWLEITCDTGVPT
jgi:SPP1 family predicted phage head-tail adaptor